MGLAAMAVALLAGPLAAGRADAAPTVDPCAPLVNPVACENSKPGDPSSEWDISGDGDPTIQGFGTDISVNVGQTIDFKIKSDASAYTVDIYRTGYYDGDGARKVASVAPSALLPQAQPECLTDTLTRLVDCGNWGVSASWAVPANAVSGVYIAHLVRTDTGGDSHIIFIVRDDVSTSDVLFQTSDTTWQGYNSYGGYNFYPSQDGRASKLSYNRPFNTRGSVTAHDFYFASEFALVQFLERNGYDVSYSTGVDTMRRGGLIQNHNVFVSAGHDEYWSGVQRTNVEAARDAGVNLAFFSGNEVYWKTRWEPSIDGSATADRTLVCYKETWDAAKTDPSAEWTGTWRDPRFSPPSDGGRPENALTGTAYKVNDLDAAVKVPAADGKMRFWRNTSVATQVDGATATLAPSTLGYESNEDLDNGFRPAGLFRLSTTTEPVDQYLVDYGATTAPGTTTHHMTMYKAQSGALVFSAGTIQWSWGLDVNHDGAPGGATEDVRMQQATVNLLADMDAQPSTLMVGLVAASASTDTAAPTSTITSPAQGASLANGTTFAISGTATDSGGGVVAGVEVSLDGGSTWHPATGRTSWSYAGSVQGSGPVEIQARAVDDSGNLQLSPVTVSVTVNCPCTLFGQDDIPAIPTTPNETSAIELGVKFTSSSDGWISGIRFYKGPSNTGTHTASLWTAGGVRLAEATYAGETASGWQTVSFNAPVEILADTTYIASYFAPNGGYSSNVNFFNAPHLSTPLRAPASGEQGANGVFRYSATSAFPSLGYQGTNYWVDPVFTNVGPPDSVAPAVLATVPVSDQVSVDPTMPIKVAFDGTMQASSIVWSVTSSGGPVAGATSYVPAQRASIFTPSIPLATGRLYTVTVSGGKDVAGNTMGPFTWNFTTWVSSPSSVNCPCTIFGGTPPAITDVNDPSEIELGVKFTSSVDGFASGVRFYKGTSNSGPFIATLWSSAGAELASSPAYFASGAGWQDVYFTSPVALSAGTTYVASYHTSSGNYAATSSQLVSPVVNGPLTALGSDASGGNGVYLYGSRGFPSNTYNATGYGVDVVFDVPADVTPPTVVSASPGAGATSVPVSALPSVSFSEAVVANSATATLTSPGGAVPVTSVLDNTGRVATFTPAASLSSATDYTLTVTGAQDVAGNTMNAPFSVTFTTSGVSVCPCTIFASDAVPAIPAAADATPVELGTRFTADADGWVTGIRFYKGAGNTGTHTGRLWSATGSELASVTFSGESASGWQTAVISPAVPVSSGATYVVSYFAPAGNYAVTPGFFASGPYVNSPLTGLADNNGVYATVEGSFPASSYNATNYWVDAVFTTATPPDTFAPTISSRNPVPGSTSVPPSTVIKVRFNEDVQPQTVSFVVRDSGNAVVAGAASYDAPSATVSFAPASPLLYGAQYSVTVSGATDTVGNVMPGPVSWSFTTAAAASTSCPCSIWPDETAPAIASDSDTSAVELGVKFRADTGGYITGARFYKGAGNTGTHTGHLWSSTGTLLATATFTSESAAGWQEVQFNPAVVVDADTTYVISYHAPNGRYAADLSYFAEAGADNGILHALRSGVDGVNGVYAYGPAGSFPVNGTTTNYWVDAVYSQTVDVSAPSVTSWSPVAGASGVAPGSQVSATLSEDVTPASVVMTLKETANGTTVPGSSTYNAGTRIATFTPSAALSSATGYTTSITATDLAGNAMSAAATATFTTLDNVAPLVSAVAASGSGPGATVTWATDEASTSVVSYGTSPSALTSNATGASGVTAHTVDLTGLAGNTRYYYRVTSVDPSGNSTTFPATTGAPASYAPTVGPIVRTSVADFAGTDSSTLVSNVAGGEVTLNPTLNSSFDGTTLGAGWTTTSVAGGGSAVVAGGQLTIDGISARSTTTHGSGRVVEFTGVLGTPANRFVGFGNTTFASGSARFGFTTGTGGQLQAVSRGGLLNLVTSQTNLTASLATGVHTYRVERQSANTIYKIDGVTVATHTVTSTTSLNVGGVDPTTGGGGITLDWMRVLPYAASGTWTSNVIDGLAPVAWGVLSWTSALNGGTVVVQVRTGNTPVPDGTWSAFATRSSGSSVGATARYLQYRITLTAPTNRLTSPTVDSVTFAFAIL